VRISENSRRNEAHREPNPGLIPVAVFDLVKRLPGLEIFRAISREEIDGLDSFESESVEDRSKERGFARY
jgi:hypothetical protein